MNIFFDTNFVLDYFVRDEYRKISDELLTKATERKHDFFISYLSVANFAYIIRKYSKADKDFYLHKLDEVFQILPNNRHQFLNALQVDAADFEDCLQYQTAKEFDCECIVTRNKGDFSFAEIPVLSPVEFIAKYLR